MPVSIGSADVETVLLLQGQINLVLNLLQLSIQAFSLVLFFSNWL